MKLERVAPWLAGLVLASPVVAFRYPPMGDLPMHEALVALMRFRNDPSFAPPGLYEVVAPQANQLFHWLAYVLSFGLGTTLACKVVVAATVLLTPVATARLLTVLHRSTWPSLLIAPIAVGWMFGWGLVANLLGFLLLIASLPLIEHLARRPTPLNAGFACAAMLAIFFAHESSAFVFAMITLYVAVVRGSDVRAASLRCSPALVALVLALMQLKLGAALRGASMDAIGSDYGLDPLERLVILPGAVFGGKDPTRLAVMCIAWVSALVACGLARVRKRPGGLPTRVALWRYRYAVLALTFFFFYVGFPMSLGGNTLLAHRFLPAACLCAVIAVARRRASLASQLLTAVVPVAMLALSWREIRATDATFRDLDVVLASVPNNVAVAQLDLTPTGPKLIAPVPGATNRVLTAHGGRVLFSFVDLPPNPVYTRRAAQWREPILRLVSSPYAFMPAWDFERFSYLLTRNSRPRTTPVLTRALAPEAELVATQGQWALYRSTLPADPIDSADRMLPTPPPETLAERVNRLRPPPP